MVTWPAPAGSDRPGSIGPCVPRCPAAAGSGRVYGSCGASSRHSPITPGSSRTGQRCSSGSSGPIAGDNPDRLPSSASFAALCGTAPIPVSSGRTDRHRLSRGGDRQANAALHHIVKVRLSYDPTTRAYRESHLAKGWTIKAVFRALKRAVAREVFRSLTGQCTVPDYTDLRPARRAKNLTLTAAAAHLGVWPARIGELKLGRRPNDQLAAAYRDWLNAP